MSCRLPVITLDGRSADDLLQEFWSRRLGYVPDWSPPNASAGAAMGPIFARFLQAILKRLNQAPDKNRLAFFDLLGLNLVPAQAARAPIVFQLTQGGNDSQAPAGTQVAAPPPPGSTDQVVFETERATGIAAAKLTQVVSLWPGRDQYLDHSALVLANKPFVLFDALQLQTMPHIIYIAHQKLLSFAGKSDVGLEFTLAQGSSGPLDIIWEYWDGEVWREFQSLTSSCLDDTKAPLDGTAGLVRSGNIHLQAGCAETALTTINGVENFWVRGRLNQPVVPDFSHLFPVVEKVRVTTRIQQVLESVLVSTPKSVTHLAAPAAGAGLATPPGIGVVVQDPLGSNLQDVAVTLINRDDPTFAPLTGKTDANGVCQFDLTGKIPAGATPDFEVDLSYLDIAGTVHHTYESTGAFLEFDVVIKVLGLRLDKAVAEGAAVDVSKPFYPFGRQPQPGATFYFNQDEVLSKPGATVRAYVSRADAPQDSIKISATPAPSTLSHIVTWEYWNGTEWALLAPSSDSGFDEADLDKTDIVVFDVPIDLTPTTVNNQEGLWIRVRLVSGGFGYTQEVDFATGTTGTNKFTYVINTPPVLADFRLGYTWLNGPAAPDKLFVYNDFQYEDHTDDVRWPGKAFTLFTPNHDVTPGSSDSTPAFHDVTPTLYLGFDRPLPVSEMGIYADIAEVSGSGSGPALVWEYWSDAGWREFVMDDETRFLRSPGLLAFIAQDDSAAMARFGTPLYWLRGRLKEDGPPGQATVNGLFLNATWASQIRTMRDEPLGAALGTPNEAFFFNEIPVLAGEQIEVRELAGAQANVEWRIIAMELSAGNPALVAQFEDLLGREGDQTDIVIGNLRLRRDRSKRVSEVWVRWTNQPNLFFSGPKDRHYTLDRARGMVIFGDGVLGKLLPIGALILGRLFKTGGGRVGNVATGAIKQLLGAVPGVQSVTNPRAGEGGADGETLPEFSRRAPLTIRNRGRALCASDYESLAYEASASVAVARAIPGHSPGGPPLPGWITLLIIPHSQEPRPVPSFGLREDVRKYIEAHAPADVAALHQINVVGAQYFPIDVTATVTPLNADQAGQVEQSALAAVMLFLHPLLGGPDGQGWELGRGVFISDLAAVLSRVEGVDYVEELQLAVNGNVQGDHVDVPLQSIVVAGEIKLDVKEAVAQ